MDPAAWLQLYLDEDLGVGDVTTNVLLPPDAIADARIVARARTFVAGLPHAQAIFSRLGAEASTPPGIQDGVWVDAGATLLEIEGPARAILTGERTALNLLARMCGIAAATRTCMESLAAVCSGAVVAATRKTTPGFRVFEKEAVALAGGDPYRKGLWDVAMVKDNHREAAGGLLDAAHDEDRD